MSVPANVYRCPSCENHWPEGQGSICAVCSVEAELVQNDAGLEEPGSNTKENARLLDRVAPDEPVFVLRARDELAPEIVRDWAYRARHAGVDAQKVVGALNVAEEMEEWQVANGKKRPD